MGYFYVNNKNDNYAYWEAMQTGEAVEMGDDDDDEYYEDDEEEEEEMEEESKDDSLDQLQQLNADIGGEVGDGTVDTTKPTGRKWFSWFRGWRRGNSNGGDGNVPSTSS